VSAIKAVTGTRDILPEEGPLWQRMESLARAHFARYGYRELRTPIFEETALFARGIGADTDIVAKEMYSFEDKDEQRTSLTLRPEATAGMVRALIEHNLVQSDPALRVYAMGPMFRREKPQRGRYRQFHQVDVEVFAVTKPSVDAEVIEMGLGYLETCGLSGLELILNSVGDQSDRPAYVASLRETLRAQASRLCEDCRRRTETNPLRVLDCKVDSCQPVIDALPRIADHLSPENREHFAEVCRELELLGVRFRLSHRLVRGLDYYTRTTFEIVSGGLGAQNTVLGGGRYDGLVKALGGPDVCGIGFALGMERLALLMPPGHEEPRCDVFLIPAAAAALDKALLLQKALRAAGKRVLMDHEGRSFKSRMKQADKLGARYVAILGEDELKRAAWSVRDMKSSTQQDVAEARVLEHLKERLDG
jgi:histidyl-tRNA synthetase